ncbi:hypothetical protein SAMN05444411_110137 [Lutibacter oricola]|uniref:Outer membrane protein beta-barrel domain-containing protein n=1 Tax=Lutibacter oricola TaxID=762486 RepID=A0A1H3F603_9FLAO|nr:tRNA modification GTPase [Lutibacter oricola]SDX86422.1 hypothetical protein SAMN05444411_110137 [Lutibacter oricola]
MKKYFLLIALAIFVSKTYSQITFEKGYFINNANQKVECFIKNVDWRKNPSEIEYKISENDKIKTIGLKTAKEFRIYNASKYIQKTVEIDKSSTKINNLSETKKVNFTTKTLFLKVLIEGKANLYSYEGDGFSKFFYSTENKTIEQLVYKTYLTKDSKIGENNRFKQQLWNNLKCASIKLNTIEKIRYKKKDLINIFSQFNNCFKSEFVNYELKEKRDLFNLSVRPQFRNSSLNIKNAVSDTKNTNFGSSTSFGLGIEAEIIFPFNKNKWAIIFEPTFQQFKSEKTYVVSEFSGRTNTAVAKYNSIELPIGVRHYFFLNNDSKIFINASYINDIPLNSSIHFEEEDGHIYSEKNVNTNTNFAFGMGYKLKNKYSIEARVQTKRQVMNSYIFWKSPYKTTSIIFGYSFL